MVANDQCPRCHQFWSKTGSEHFNSDIKVVIVVSVFTLGVGLIFGIPVMLWRGITGFYNPNRHFCYNCNNQW